MNTLYLLEQISAAERLQIGEKAFHLGRIATNGYPVVPSCVVPAQTLWKFLAQLNSSDPLIADLPESSLRINVDDSHQLQKVAQRLQQEILAAPLPEEYWRSLLEATQSWQASALIFRPSLILKTTAIQNLNFSGLLEAQICCPEPEAIALALKQTWSQLFRARSLLYWQRHRIEWRDIHLAVLVQPLQNAIASGILTCNPSEIEISATWGLGIAIARGEVSPDLYFVSTATNQVRSRQLGNKILAYGVGNIPFISDLTLCTTSLLPSSVTPCLQTYLLSEAQQQQYALSDESLQQLIQLTQQLKTDLGAAFYLEWTLAQTGIDAKPQLYLTHANTYRVREPAANSQQPKEDSEFRIPPRLSKLRNSEFISGIAAARGEVIAPAYVIAKSEPRPVTIPAGSILVAPAIAPDWLPLLQQAAGIITEQGGLTSHSAILARELGIPAVVSVARATGSIRTGELLELNGDRGEVWRRGDKGDKGDKGEVKSQNSKVKISRLPTPDSQLPTIATQLMLNLSQPSLIAQVKDLPVDGVGLLRSELMMLNVLEGQHPRVWLQQGRQAELLDLWKSQISQFVNAFAPRPVFYRSLDWRSPEFQSLNLDGVDAAAGNSRNSILGQRGTLSYLKDPKVFDLELAALAAVQQSGQTNLHLMLPFVRSVEEFSFCRQRVEQAGLTQVAQFQLWIVAEVPSVLFLLPQYVKAGVQGVSIGTNDLTQLLLGVDRDRGELAANLNERHPAVLQAIAQIIQMAQQANISCSICGQAPVLYPEIIDSLIQSGITSISVEPNAVEQTYRAIARAEQRLLLAAARKIGAEGQRSRGARGN
ncbi:putative PEP-binding protein [Chroococcidiopsis sp. CCNUC1]|uniref:putative PEP-binding protein n=1 Tax=Chroococcidiopsis sp. CCNUC1 TaxID=2653189 RepID=UPI002020CFF8|nr:putative PEP-binding protein [Chroococcidiopsis sp. CCNUC1]URD47939.1 PEP-utilizing enzyme [Chroococcidiopsis sp. CCNUC1]